jgi:hypothetical protein
MSGAVTALTRKPLLYGFPVSSSCQVDGYGGGGPVAHVKNSTVVCVRATNQSCAVLRKSSVR